MIVNFDLDLSLIWNLRIFIINLIEINCLSYLSKCRFIVKLPIILHGVFYWFLNRPVKCQYKILPKPIECDKSDSTLQLSRHFVLKNWNSFTNYSVTLYILYLSMLKIILTIYVTLDQSFDLISIRLGYPNSFFIMTYALKENISFIPDSWAF